MYQGKPNQHLKVVGRWVEIDLIIAEKPSLARNIVAGIGKMDKKNGYYEGQGYIVTWVFGHLFELADIEEYNPAPDGSKYWTLNNLPCFPENFKYNLKRNKDKTQDSGVLRQFEVITSLCNRSDVTRIINAGDSDREGEIIVRTCVCKAFGLDSTDISLIKQKKEFSRLWLPDQTEQTVKSALSDMKGEEHYNNLADEGYARTYVDWLYGVNLTRFATLKTGTLLRVGRVIVPIVKVIYDRDMQIENFVPEKYYGIQSSEKTKDQVIDLLSKLKFDNKSLNQAQEYCNKLNSQKAVVIRKTSKKDKLSAGKLYSLSKLQNVLGKKYKMPMDKSLAILQKLYEEGYVTYPRTNSEYLAVAEKEKIQSILSNLEKLGYPVCMKHDKSIFDDSKIESHSALTPTYKIPDKSKLTEQEMQVYSTIFRRFAAVFCSEDCIASKTEMVIDVGGIEQFSLKGTVIVQPGWTKYDDYAKKDKTLPNLEKGDEVTINFKPVEKETTPPKHYTIETLNNYLKNPFRDDKANLENQSDEDEYKAIFEGLELGTEATRTGIIENAIKSNYISLKKDTYYILDGGKFLIEALSRMKISMDKYKTSELGKALKKVYRGEISIKDSVELAAEEIRAVFNTDSNQKIEFDTDDGFVGDIIGKCPLCTKDVVRTKFGYGCTGYKDGCKFSLNNIICKRVISVSNVKLLLETGKTSKIEGFISKNSKPFSAYLVLNDGKAVFSFD